MSKYFYGRTLDSGPFSVTTSQCNLRLVSYTLATFRLQLDDDYENEFSVLSTRLRFGWQKFSKCACSELKTRTRSGPRTTTWRSLIWKKLSTKINCVNTLQLLKKLRKEVVIVLNKCDRCLCKCLNYHKLFSKFLALLRNSMHVMHADTSFFFSRGFSYGAGVDGNRLNCVTVNATDRNIPIVWRKRTKGHAGLHVNLTDRKLLKIWLVSSFFLLRWVTDPIDRKTFSMG